VAPSAGTLRVGRYFAALFALLVVLYGIVFWPHQPRTPKLGLDLKGGAQVILKAQTDNNKTPSKQAMNQARQIITNRVNGLGVANAEVVIQGSNQIVISVPGKTGDELKSVSQAALLQFRPLLQQATAVTPATTATPSASGTAVPSGSSTAKSSSTASSATAKPSGTATAKASPSPHGRVIPHAAGTTSPAKATPSASAKSSAAKASPTSTPSSAKGIFSPTAAGAAPIDQWARIDAIAKQVKITFTPPTSATQLQALGQTQSQLLQAAVSSWPCDNNTRPVDDVTKPLITCDSANQNRYLLGPVIVQGKQVKSASALGPGSQQGQVGWVVSVSLNSSGQAAWAKYTSQHNETSTPGDVANTVANTLDSKVIEASTIQQTINTDTQISGNFTQQSANALANALKYGALPLNFQTLTNTSVSATLGSDQLKAGLLAGGIGLALVVVYSLIYYRALGLVTIASLLVSGGLTYAMLVILGKQIDFTLTLAGIAGFIVAVGITADSFVVFFERIKDEVHEGRTARVAIPRAWERSRRTIISADTVSLLAAVILYYFAAGDVRGFAFTLGLSTLLDLIVVFLFTHPIVSLFSRSAAFGSGRFTGLNHMRASGMALATAGGPDPELVTVSTSASAASQDVAPRRAPARKAKSSPQPRAQTVSDETSSASDAPGRETPVAVGSTAAERAAARRGRGRPSTDGTDNSSEEKSE
jgi:preprotein translocase subunit SecD